MVPVALLTLVITLASCKKAADPAATEALPTIITTEGGLISKKLSTHASKLGFAEKLPADTQLFFGTLGMRDHLKALSATSYFDELSAFLDDKTPAPSADKKGPSSKWLAPAAKPGSICAMLSTSRMMRSTPAFFARATASAAPPATAT